MSCLSLGFLYQLCVWIIIAVACYSILKLLLPYVTQFLPALVVQIISIVIWAIIALVALYIIFMLLSCIIGGMPGLGHLR